MTLAGTSLLASLAPSPFPGTLGLLVLATGFSLLLTAARFSQCHLRQKISFILSFIGGYLMLLTPILVIVTQYQILRQGSCELLYFYGWGTPVAVYYSVVNRLAVAGIAAVLASLLYALFRRAYLLSIPILGFATWLFYTTLSSTQLPTATLFLSAPVAIGCILIIVESIARSIKSEKPQFPGQITDALTTQGVVVVISIILVLGAFSGLWAYAGEAPREVWVHENSTPGDWFAGNGFARNETISLTNPSYLPIDGVWMMSYNYTGPRLVQSDTESFHIPGHGTTAVSLTFTGVDPRQIGQVSSFNPVVKILTVHYHTVLWSFEEEDQFVFERGPPSGKILGPSISC
jgi:hypothetical protein